MPRPISSPWLWAAAGATATAGIVAEERPRSRIRVPRSRGAGAGAGGGIGALTVLTATLVAPAGTLAVWPQSGQRTVEPGATDVTSIDD
jgi:hypothetical protein